MLTYPPTSAHLGSHQLKHHPCFEPFISESAWYSSAIFTALRSVSDGHEKSWVGGVLLKEKSGYVIHATSFVCLALVSNRIMGGFRGIPAARDRGKEYSAGHLGTLLVPREQIEAVGERIAALRFRTTVVGEQTEPLRRRTSRGAENFVSTHEPGTPQPARPRDHWHDIGAASLPRGHDFPRAVTIAANSRRTRATTGFMQPRLAELHRITGWFQFSLCRKTVKLNHKRSS